VQIQAVTPDLAKSFNLDADKGALVSDVVKESPADKAGVKAGDVILEFDGRHIGEFNELPRLVAVTPVDKKARMVVFRDGKRLELTVSVGKLKEGETSLAAGTGSANEKLGITVQELTKDLASQLGVRDSKGLVVTEIKPGSPAEDAGVTPGSTIVEINGIRPDSLEQYSAEIAKLKKGDVVRLLLRKPDGNTMYVAIKIAE
jgi:serine protease Do